MENTNAPHFDASSICFRMGFSDHCINCFTALKKIGLLSEQPVPAAEGVEIVPLKAVKACLPDFASLAQALLEFDWLCTGSVRPDGRNEVFY